NKCNAVENKEEELQTTEKPQVIDYTKAVDKTPKSKTRVAENRTLIKKDSKLNDTKDITKELLLLKDEAMMKDAVADALKKLKSEKTSVIDKEVDSLLKLASKELFKDQIQNETTKTVDANALLMSVEDEMGQSFRSKVFEVLKDSYETVKTAVAERNN
uniref:hypothetical protein n=1 Tax=Winogradskyella sp. TaxID=1883156 RepID=UPI003F6D9CD9